MHNDAYVLTEKPSEVIASGVDVKQSALDEVGPTLKMMFICQLHQTHHHLTSSWVH